MPEAQPLASDPSQEVPQGQSEQSITPSAEDKTHRHKQQIYNRDNGICALCGTETRQLTHVVHVNEPETARSKPGFIVVPCSYSAAKWYNDDDRVKLLSFQSTDEDRGQGPSTYIMLAGAALAFDRCSDSLTDEDIELFVESGVISQEQGGLWIEARHLTTRLVALYALRVSVAKIFFGLSEEVTHSLSDEKDKENEVTEDD
ncbi:hypothetical protein FRB90_004442 [Tulasnella sp. 427]|nr:hypothetical protein FRB90_004442 [Tulasnella sp. 427]